MADNSFDFIKSPWIALLSLILGAGGLGGHFLKMNVNSPVNSVHEITHEVIHEESRAEFLRRINADYNHCTHNLVHQHSTSHSDADLACSMKKFNKLIERQVR